MGRLVKAFDPGLTGRYNYDKRLEVTKKQSDAYGKVELPSALKPNF
jgi:hypothetical protein